MILRKLVIENYKSFQFPTEIQFPASEKYKSIFLIGGMNGAGKSSIMEAINYCLYGVKNEEIYRCINRKEKSRNNTAVSFELVLEEDDGAELIIKRFRFVQSIFSSVENNKSESVKTSRLLPSKASFTISAEIGSRRLCSIVCGLK